MIINALRTFYFITPVIILAWFLMAHDNMMATLTYINKWQGATGILHINPADESTSTWGDAMTAGLNSVLGATKDSDWGNFDEKMGSDLDRMILSIENYWVDLLATFLFFGGFILCVSRKSYR